MLGHGFALAGLEAVMLGAQLRGGVVALADGASFGVIRSLPSPGQSISRSPPPVSLGASWPTDAHKSASTNGRTRGQGGGAYSQATSHPSG